MCGEDQVFLGTILLQAASIVGLSYPCPIESTTAPGLSLFKDYHVPPFLLVNRINVATGFNTHSAPWSSSRQPVHFRHINEFAGVELKCWLRTESLEMDFGVWMVELAKLLYRFLASVQRNACWVGIHNETMVYIWLLSPKRELFVFWYSWKLFNGASWNCSVINDLMQVGAQCRLGPFESRPISNIEGAAVQSQSLTRLKPKDTLPVVRQ